MTSPVSIVDSEPSALCEKLHTALHEHFGFREFRPGQEAVVAAAVSGETVLGVMPTGTGKSLCYQLTAILRPGGTLVISPLIALMKDQADALAGMAGIRSGILNSSVGRAQQDATLRAWEAGELDILYAAPERFRNARFVEALRAHRPDVLAVDEAHCISQWGHDFRPDYLVLRHAVRHFQIPVVMALTATATPEVQADILTQLGITDARVIVTGFDRPNLYLEVHRLASDRAKRDRLKTLMDQTDGSGIVYCGTRKQTEETADFLRKLGVRAMTYHGDLDPEMRTAVQNEFMHGDIEVVCATNAFGLGVNKPDIRFVIHLALPGTLEALYQEMGRAGRDGLPARCSLLFSPSDLPLQRFFIQAATPTRADLDNLYGFVRRRGERPEFDIRDAARTMDASDIRVRSALSELEKARLVRRLPDSENGSIRVRVAETDDPTPALAEREEVLSRVRAERLKKLQTVETYARLPTCRRAFIRRYFGEVDVPEQCGACDVCAPRSDAFVVAPAGDVERSAEVGETILRCVARFNGRVGRATIAQVLAGSQSKKIQASAEWYGDFLGRLKHLPGTRIAEAIEELMTTGYVEAGVLSRNEAVFPVLQLTELGRSVARGEHPAPAVAVSRAAVPSDETAPPDRAAPPDDAGGLDLYDRLKKWRLGEASRAGVAAFVILSNADLNEVVAHRPRTKDALLNLRGFGPGKVEKWGDVILWMVNESGQES